MYADVQSKPSKFYCVTLWVNIYVSLLIVLYLLGSVPIWLKSRETSRELVQAERQLSLASMQNSLVFAIVHAQSADYESARQAAITFFTSLRAEMDVVDDASPLPVPGEALQPLLAQRDGIITLLARGDQASAEQLSDLYVEFRETIKR